jgi:hypothetical protein
MTENGLLIEQEARVVREWSYVSQVSCVHAVPNIRPITEAASISETSVNLYQTTRRYNPEDSHLHTRLPWKRKIWVVFLTEDPVKPRRTPFVNCFQTNHMYTKIFCKRMSTATAPDIVAFSLSQKQFRVSTLPKKWQHNLGRDIYYWACTTAESVIGFCSLRRTYTSTGLCFDIVA